MADIRLLKPVARSAARVACTPDARFVFDFPSDEAVFSRDGDNLLLTFDDGSSLVLENFYGTFSKEQMPSFQLDDVEISGEDFFAALGDPSLMPAAGPAASATAQRGGGFGQYGNAELLDGIDRLGGLDIGFNWGQRYDDDLWGWGSRDVDYGVSVVPTEPGLLDPSIPVIDNPDNPNDNNPGHPVSDVLTVFEAGLENGSKHGGEDVPTVASGSMQISAPDGVASIVIGSVTVWANGSLVLKDGEPVKVWTDEGYLQVSGFNPATGRLEYSYTLVHATQEHEDGKDSDDHFAHNLQVTVTDRDGDTGSSNIAIVIKDDNPEAYDDYNSVTEKESQDVSCSGNVLRGTSSNGEDSKADIFGADGPAGGEPSVVWLDKDGKALQFGEDGTVKVESQYGTIMLKSDGSYEYKLDGENAAVRDLDKDAILEETFRYTIADADADPAGATLTITINGANHGVELHNDSGTLVVDEADLVGGSKAGTEEAPVTASGSLTITAHDGLATITIGGVTVVEGGKPVPDAEVKDKVGELEVGSLKVTKLVDNHDGTWRLEYTYTLKNPTTEHNDTGTDRLDKPHIFDVVATDQDDDKSTTGTITVDIIDDVPTAHSDTNEVKEGDPTDGQPVIATGNVITGENSTSPDSADTVGADGATVTAITGEYGKSEKGEGDSLTIAGQYGTLTIYPNGEYTYTLNETHKDVMGLTEESTPLTDSFTYTLTDADKDSSSVNLTITITGKDHNVCDFVADSILVDEDNLPSGNKHKDNDITDEFTGTFTVSAHDGLAWLAINGTQVQLTLNADGTVTVSNPKAEYDDGNFGYLTIDKIEGAGDYTVTYTYHLENPEQHSKPAEGTLADRNHLENNKPHSIKVTIKDQDDLAQGKEGLTGEIKVDIIDDVPLLSGILKFNKDSAGLVQESNLGSDGGAFVTVDLGAAFKNVEAKYGADGAATDKDAAVYSLELSADSVATNLLGLTGDGDKASYVPIYLVMGEDDSIQGVTEDGTVCLTITVDPENGKTTFTLLQPVRHPEQGAPDVVSLETVKGSLKLTYTITDKDGDQASVSLDLGANEVFQIQDSMTTVAVKKDVSASLAVDESFVARPNGPDRPEAEDDTSAAGSSTAAFDASTLFTIKAGADDQGLSGLQVNHSFALKIDKTETGLSGLVDGKTGDIVLVKNEDGSIVGCLNGDTSMPVFTLTINAQSGSMTLTLAENASVVHPDREQYDESAELKNCIKVELTVTDWDGDPDSASADVTLKFEDDGPALTLPDAQRMTSTTSGDTSTLTGTMTFNFGADGPATVNGPAAAAGIVVTVTDGGQSYRITCTRDADGIWSGSTEDGKHSFTVNAEGDFSYTRPASKDGTADSHVVISVTLTDGDGDTITQTTTEYAPDITVGYIQGSSDGAGLVKEAGVAGHDTDPDGPNADVSGNKTATGTITLSQDGEDADTLTLTLWGGSVTHTRLTDTHKDGADKTADPVKSSVEEAVELSNNTTFYVVQDEKGNAVLSKELPADGAHYGTLTFTSTNGTDWNWSFALDEDSALVNSMTEKETIKLELQLGVSDGMLKDNATLNITIQGTNDGPVFVVSDEKPTPVGEGELLVDKGDIVLTDETGSENKNLYTGTLYATDPDADNGAGITNNTEDSGDKNNLKFTVEAFAWSKAGSETEGYNEEYDADSQEAINLISSVIKNDNGEEVTADSDDKGSYTKIETTYGTLKVYEDGTYTYTVTPDATKKIGDNEYVTEVFTVRVTDAHGSYSEEQITITLTDKDDAIIKGKDLTESMREEGVVGDDSELMSDTVPHNPNQYVPESDPSPTDPGNTVLFTDPDINDTVTLSIAQDNVTFTGADDNNVGPTISLSVIENIKVGEYRSEATVLWLVASESNEAGWTLSWQAQNDMPSGDVVGKLTLTRGEDGSISYDFDLDPGNTDKDEDSAKDNSAFLDQLAQGDTVEIPLNFSATSDGDSSQTPVNNNLTLTITGTNDKPVITGVTYGDNAEDTGKVTVDQHVYPAQAEETGSDGEQSEPDLKGVVTAYDVDMDNGAGSTAVDGKNAHKLIFTLDMSGEDSFTSSTAGLPDDSEDTITESVAHGEDSYQPNGAAGNFDDQYTSVKTTYGTLEIKPDTGEFTYTMDEPELDAEGNPNPIMALGAGQSVTETYTIRVTDAHGSWDEQTITITIKGTNDRPILTVNNLEIHAAEEKTPDNTYHDGEPDKSHPTAQAKAEDPDLNDANDVTFCFASDENGNVNTASVSSNVSITAEALLKLLEDDASIFNGGNGDPDTLALLKAHLKADDTAERDIATLTISDDGTLSLELNQNSTFVQALNNEDSFTFNLSAISEGLNVYAKDDGELYSAKGADVKLVIHGTDDAYVVTSSDAPQVKEEGVYKDKNNNANAVTDPESGTAYGQALRNADGSFTIDGPDAGRVSFTVVNEEGEAVGGASQEHSTTFRGETISFSNSTEAHESMYVLGDYGYYTIDLSSTMDDGGNRTFEYTYTLYTDGLSEEVRSQLGLTDENFADKLKNVDSLPQGVNIKDSVTLKVEVGQTDAGNFTLSADVSGTNDRPVINGVDVVTPAEGASEVALTEGTSESELGANQMYFKPAEEEQGSATLHIKISCEEGNTFVGMIKGIDPDTIDAAQGQDARGTEVVNYSFVVDGSSTQVWQLSEDGETAYSQYGRISIDSTGKFTIVINQEALKALGKDEPLSNIFDGLTVQCTDDLGATSQLVGLVGTLLGKDDAASVTVNQGELWENRVNAHDESVDAEVVPTGDKTGIVEGDDARKLTGTITVRDPDGTDTIDFSITVEVNDATYIVSFNEGGEVSEIHMKESEDLLRDEEGNTQTTIKGTNGFFSFELDKNENGDTVLTYHYTVTDEDNIKEQISDLNDGETWSSTHEGQYLDSMTVSFTSNHDKGDSAQSDSVTINVDVHGTNDAPVITGVTPSDNAEAPVTNKEQLDNLQDGAYTHQEIGYQESVSGQISVQDDDDDLADLGSGGDTDSADDKVTQFLQFGFLTTKDETPVPVFAKVNDKGITEYYKYNDDGDPTPLTNCTLGNLNFTTQLPLDKGTICVNDDGTYTYYRNPGDTEAGLDFAYITVRDPQGAMDSVRVDFKLQQENPKGRLPDVKIENVTVPEITEPSGEGDRVVAGAEDSTVSSFNKQSATTMKLTISCIQEDGKYIPVYEENGQLYKQNGGLVTASKEEIYGKLVYDRETNDYSWQYYTEGDEKVTLEPEPTLEFYLLNDANQPVYSLSTPYGTVYVDKNTGELHYELDSRADALNAGETVTSNVTLVVNGNPLKDIPLTVTGTGDPSEITAEDKTLDLRKENELDEVTGTITITDIDNSDGDGQNRITDEHTVAITLNGEDSIELSAEAQTVVYVMREGEQVVYTTQPPEQADNKGDYYGKLTFTPAENGYTYTFEAYDSTATKEIAPGQSMKFEFELTVTDESTVSDQEAGGTHNNKTTSTGSFTITLVGKADRVSFDSQELHINEEAVKGSVDEGIFTPDKEGVNDTLTVDGNLGIEDFDDAGSYTVTGKSEAEGSTDSSFSSVVKGEYGTLILNNDGSYSYVLAYDKCQELGVSDESPAKDVFTVQVTNDASPVERTVTINIHGVNDLPVVTVTPVLSVQEGNDDRLTAEGTISAQDVDTSDTLSYGVMVGEGEAREFVSTSAGAEGIATSAIVYVVGNWSGDKMELSLSKTEPSEDKLVGTLTIEPDGSYTFKVAENGIAQQLNGGSSASIEVNIGAWDQHDDDPVTRPVTITVHGTNQAPVVKAALTASEDEVVEAKPGEQQYSITFKPDATANDGYTATDIDHDDTMTYTFEQGGRYFTETEAEILVNEQKYDVTLSIDENGVITMKYDEAVKEAINALSYGREAKLVSPAGLNLVVQDKFGGKTSEELSLTITGTNDDVEVESQSDPVTITDTGTGTLPADIPSGTFTFTDVDANDTHTVKLPEKVSVTLPGNNTAQEANVNEEGKVTLDGKELGTLTACLTQKSTDGNPGKVTYTFTPDTGVLSGLGRDESIKIDAIISVNDTIGDPANATVSFELKGMNDNVVVAEPITTVVITDGADSQPDPATFTFTDADTSDKHTVTLPSHVSVRLSENETEIATVENGTVKLGGKELGTLTAEVTHDSTNGGTGTVKYSFVPDKAYLSSLGDNEMVTIEAVITVSDGTVSNTANVTFELHGANDDVEDVNADIATPNADGSWTGTLIFSDADVRDTHTVTLEGLYATKDGQTSGGVLSVNTGNLGTPAAVYTKEGWLIGSMSFELDQDENGAERTLTYKFTPAEDLNHLPVDGIQLTFTVSVQEGSNTPVAASEQLSFTVTNANDAPDLTVNENGNTGTFSFTDADKLDTHTISLVYGGTTKQLNVDNGSGTVTFDDLGTFTFIQQADGSWGYKFAAESELKSTIAFGATETKQVKIQVQDASEQTDEADIPVIITGTNAEPTVTQAAEPLTVLNWGDSFSVLSATDPEDDELTWSFTDPYTNGVVQGTYGTLTYNADSGTYIYKLDTSDGKKQALAKALDELEDGAQLTESFSYTVSDDVNAPADGSVTLTLDLSAESLLWEDDTEDSTDVMVYNPDAYMLDGGQDITFMVSERENLSLDDMLKGGGEGPIVQDVEVLITGAEVESLTDSKQLAEKLDISINEDGQSLTLGSDWQKVEGTDSDNTHIFTNDQLRLETTLNVEQRPSEDSVVQAAVDQLNNTF